MELGFILKKFITFFVEPLGIILALFVFGIYFLYRDKNSLAKLFLTFSLGFLMCLIYHPFPLTLAICSSSVNLCILLISTFG